MLAFKFAVVLIIAVVTVSSSLSADWEAFKTNFNKRYASIEEEMMRRQIFLENVEKMRIHQQRNPDATYTLGINDLADRKTEELVSRSKFGTKFRSLNQITANKRRSFPDSFDWRTKGVISPVENEGVVGDVAAIVAVEVIESFHAIETGNLVRGSVARVVDCCPQPTDPFECILKMGGLCTQADYPTPTGKCIPNQCKPAIKFSKVNRLKTPDENAMVAWIQNSTLSVGIDASHVSFQMYQSGIYADPSCSSKVIDHELQVVGYGKTASGQLFWICKNSWGNSWGELGYVRILRGKNTCGIATYVTQVA